MDNKWSSKDSRVFASPTLPKSPATGYSKPDLRKVAVSISSDEPDFIPVYSSGCNEADLFANIPSQNLFFPKGGCQIIDCGFSLSVATGYRICVSSSINNVFLNLVDASRVKVNAINLGEELTLQHKQKIGKIWIEPVYFFEWITKG